MQQDYTIITTALDQHFKYHGVCPSGCAVRQYDSVTVYSDILSCLFLLPRRIQLPAARVYYINQSKMLNAVWFPDLTPFTHYTEHVSLTGGGGERESRVMEFVTNKSGNVTSL
ncbi:hypothetical protein Btru_050480 [Bulinus truncatus]|nr:hypothetical protein Btru_050480 [Bulinus truncatus]